MKQRLYLLLMLVLPVANTWAQTPYPSAPASAGNIVRMEYFIDTDPGQGKGTAVPVTPALNISNLSVNVNVNGLTPGFHRVYFRSQDARGGWSLTNNSFFDNVTVPAYPTAPAGSIIQEIEYYIDTDPGIGKATKLPVTPAANIVNASYNINVTGLAAGVHRLFMRSKDAMGKWSITSFGLFDNSAVLPYPTAAAPAGNITQLEYFIDTDPGFGKGTALTITPSTDISNLSFNVPVNGLTQGNHHLYIRSRSTPWSTTTVATFTIGGTLPVSWLYVRGAITDEGSLIEWSTAQESNTLKFVVEHSTDGLTYQPVGELKAAGNSQAPLKYQFLHKGVQSGFHYYRIRQVDKDERFSYSRTITLLQQSGLSKATLSPNPATTDMVHLVQAAPVDVRKVQVHDQQGKLAWQQNYDLKSVKVLSIPVGQLPPGTYVLTVHTGKETQVHRFLKL